MDFMKLPDLDEVPSWEHTMLAVKLMPYAWDDIPDKGWKKVFIPDGWTQCYWLTKCKDAADHKQIINWCKALDVSCVEPDDTIELKRLYIVKEGTLLYLGRCHVCSRMHFGVVKL